MNKTRFTALALILPGLHLLFVLWLVRSGIVYPEIPRPFPRIICRGLYQTDGILRQFRQRPGAAAAARIAAFLFCRHPVPAAVFVCAVLLRPRRPARHPRRLRLNRPYFFTSVHQAT